MPDDGSVREYRPQGFPVVALPLNLRRDAFGIEFCP